MTEMQLESRPLEMDLRNEDIGWLFTGMLKILTARGWVMVKEQKKARES